MPFAFAGRFFEVALGDDGQPLRTKSFKVFRRDSDVLAVLYTDARKTQPLVTQPVTSADGNMRFYADFYEAEDGENGAYDVLVEGSSKRFRVYVDEPSGDTLNTSDLGVRVASLIENEDGSYRVDPDLLPDSLLLTDVGTLVPALVKNADGTNTIDPKYLPGGVGSAAGGVLDGVGPPPETLGALGQLYFDKQNVAFYGPKQSTGWGSPVSAKGIKGDTGVGTPGNNGLDGRDGNRLLYGKDAPQNALGLPNDFYVQYDGDPLAGGKPVALWGPKSQGAGWGTVGASLAGPAGVDGVDGDSAYQLWLAAGNTGSQADFLTSLKGVKGDTGAPGASDVLFRGVYAPATNYAPKDQVAYQGLLYIANIATVGTAPVEGGSSTWAQATARGPAGANGSNGAAGKSLLVGTADPVPALGLDGDSYFNKAARTFFGPKASGAWPVGVSLVGAAGTNGTNGTNGLSLRTGNGAPPNTLGVNNEVYLDLENQRLYGPKAGGVWPTEFTSIKGAKGDTGVAGPAGSIPLDMLLRGPFDFRVPSYDSNGRMTSSTVVWPDRSPGVYTPTAFAPNDPDTIDAYTVTHIASGAQVVQAAPTRKADGDFTNLPEKQIVYSGNLPDYDPSSPQAIRTGVIYAETIAGYVADGVTDMSTWLQNVLDNLPFGKQLTFGLGLNEATQRPRIALSKTVVIRENCMLFPPRPKWGYKGQPPISFVPTPNVTFTGTAMFRVEAPTNGAINLAYLKNLVAYGQKTDGSGPIADIHGLELVGETFGVITDHCLFRRFGRWGVKYSPIVNADNSGKQSRGHEHHYLSTESCGIGGLDTDGLTDSNVVAHHGHYCGINSTDVTACSVYIRGAGDLKYTDGRATFCERGIITGNSTITSGRPNSHSIKVTGFSSDRMRYGGLHHRATGTRVWEFANCVFGRDGRYTAHPSAEEATALPAQSFGIVIGESQTAPLESASQRVAPVIFTGCQTQVGADDATASQANNSSPATGMLLLRNGYVSYSGGVLMGKVSTTATGTGADLARVSISTSTLLGTGTRDTPVWTIQPQGGGGSDYLLYVNGAYPARPAGLANGQARYKGPVKPSDIQTLDDWIETDA